MRKQPKRVVKPRVYFDLVDYDSDFDDKAESASSPARKRGTGPRLSEGNEIQINRYSTQRLAAGYMISKMKCKYSNFVIIIIINIFCPNFLLCSKDFVSLDGFLGDISDDEVRHRKSSSHRGLPSRRKPEKVTNFSVLLVSETMLS